MIRRFLFIVVVIGIAATAIVSGILAYCEYSKQSGLTLDASSRDLGLVSPDEQKIVPFIFRNRTAKPICIIGAEQTCGKDGCNELKSLPVEISPWSDIVVEVTFNCPSSECEFCKKFPVFSDYPEHPHIDLMIYGTVRNRISGEPAKSSSSRPDNI